MSLEVRLHLGAHKTATTHIQQTLLGSREKLGKTGVHYIELHKLRKIFTRRFDKIFGNSGGVLYSSEVQTLRSTIRDEVGRAAEENKQQFSTLVLSDENIMGHLPKLAHTGKLYGDRARRLELVRAIFIGCPITVAFAIRNYNDFYPSAYTQAIRMGWSIPYDDYLRRLDLENNAWRIIVADLSRIFGRDRIRLFRYEDYPANSERLFESIIGRRLSSEFDGTQIVYRSLNLKGIELLLAAGRA